MRDRLDQLVVDDVNATVASGSYDMTFNDTTTPATQCDQSPGNGQEAGGSGQKSTVTTVEPCWTENTLPPGISTHTELSSISGHGTVDTNPYAMVTESDVGSLGKITLYDNGTNVWEIGGGDYGLAAPGQAGPGAPLSGYAGSVEGTVGQVAGALDMQGLASGTGYLDLEAQEIQGAQPAGTGSVDGVPVTIYELHESGLEDPTSAVSRRNRRKTIRAADAIIESSGFAGKTTWVSVDSEGYIREQKTSYTLPNGSTVTEDTVLSNFGCAGTVLMPGQQGSSAPPSGCVSPDHASGGSTVSPTPTSTSGTSSSTTTPTNRVQRPTITTSGTSALVPQRPTALAVGPNGNLYIADPTRNQILERLPGGTFVVVAGTGTSGFAGDGGPAVKAELDRPDGMAFAADGTLYFADEGNGRVRAVSPSGIITTVVGSGDSPAVTPFRRAPPPSGPTCSPTTWPSTPGGQLYISTGEQVLRLDADGTLDRRRRPGQPRRRIYGVGRLPQRTA